MSFLSMLWFDVGLKRYTTAPALTPTFPLLWFDVGLKRYTTKDALEGALAGCGLM